MRAHRGPNDMATKSTTRKASMATQGAVNLGEIRYAMSNARSTFTRVRTQRANHTTGEQSETQADFITLVSLVCNIYRDSENDLNPIQQFHPDAERHEDGGHTCVVSQRAISTSAASNFKRGTTDFLAEDIVVKRTRQSVLEPRSSGLKSLINELSIRTHPPIRVHPNIVKFKGIAWDFEDDGATKPRPLLLEELAPQRSLEGFWSKYNFVRMTFHSKIELCLDIAEGLAALHACHIVHGDVKPENILIFPRIGHQDSFMAKLTDFGHSASAHENLTTLPAFTEQWCAPEVLLDDHCLDFAGMIATDVYSFGLVILSVFIGRAYYRSLVDYTSLKREGNMFASAMDLVEQEDRQSHDSDFELDTIRMLLRATIRQQSSRRSLVRCVRILRRYLATQDGSTNLSIQSATHKPVARLKGLEVGQMVSIGYQTLALCSHQLKSRVASELELIAKNDRDSRQHIAAWELSICYFSGFGVPRDFTSSSRWLDLAVLGGIPAAQTFSQKMREAMNIVPHPSNHPIHQRAGIDESIEEELHEAQTCDLPKPIARDDIRLLAQEDNHDASTIEELQSHEQGLREYDADIDLVSDTESEASEELSHDRRLLLTTDIVTAIKNDRPEALVSYVSRTPGWSKHKDGRGDNVLLLAARYGSYRSMRILTDHDNADASICNDYQESALHLMSNFSEEQFQELVPKLINRGADPYHETRPLRYGNDFLNISASIRCCPILRAILSDNLPLLECLLEATHRSESSTLCRLCEGGSRLKRIVAIALSTFRAEALRTIVDHIKVFKDNAEVNLGKIEVWSNQKLIPLWKTPFRSVIIRTVDLPESFFRAISYGERHMNVLHFTLSFLLDHFSDTSKLLYKMLQEAVRVNSLDAVDFILQEGQRRRLNVAWWLPLSKSAFPYNPLIIAIRHGLRTVFERLWDSNRQVFLKFIQINAEIDPASIARYLPSTSTQCIKKHSVNVTQICLSIAVTAAHQDQFFFNFILQHTHHNFLVQQPRIFDGIIGNHPTFFLAQAILTSSFGAASTISQKFPQAWQHKIRLQKTSEKQLRDNALLIMRQFPYEYLQFQSSIADRMLKPVSYTIAKLTGGEYWTISNPTLPEYILLVGSYKHCRFLLEYLHTIRTQKKTVHLVPTTSGSSLTIKAEAGIEIDWKYCHLSPKEFWCLMIGNVVREREDREDLWDVISAQVSNGHAKKMVYLRLAIRHGTNKALNHLLDLGWDANGPFWAYFMSPYRLATRMEREAKYLLKRYDAPVGWDTPRWGDLDTHKGVFEEYKREQEKIYENYEQLAKQNSATLKERGGRMPILVERFRNRRFYFIVTVIYAFIYGLFLPVVLTLITAPYWKWNLPFKKKLLWMYFWSSAAVLSPPLLLFNRRIFFFTSHHVMVQILLSIQLVLQHLLPLILVIKHKGGLAAWILPACIVGPELLLAVAYGSGLLIIFTMCGVVDCCYTLFSYCCGKGLRPGPFNIL